MNPDRRKALAVGGVAAAAALAGLVVGPLVLQSRSGVPELLTTVFPDLQGQPRRLGDWSGRPVVCNFWATWCAPCREEIPLLVALRDKFESRGPEIVGIGIDQHAKIVEFAEKYGIRYPLLVGDVRALDVMRGLGNKAGALPYTVVLSPAGAVIYEKLGQVHDGELDGVLDGILG
jgi:thiol-disulfide isomerase/thioredoxin